MKIGIFSDLHLHNFRQFSGADGRRRLHDGLVALENYFREFVRTRCDRVIFCGDLFHSRKDIDVDVLMSTINTFKKIIDADGFRRSKLKPERVYFLRGNHDTYDNHCSASLLKLMHEFGFTVIDSPAIKHAGAVSLVFVPWMPIQQQVQYLDRIRTVYKHRMRTLSYLFIHCLPAGASTPAGFRFKNGVDFSKYDKYFTKIYCGDVHKRQSFGKVQIVGSAMHHTFADVGEEKGFDVLDTNDSTQDKFIVMNNWFPNFKFATDDDALNTYDYFQCASPDGNDPPIKSDNIEVVPYSADNGAVDVPEIVMGASKEEIITNYVLQNKCAGVSADALIRVGLDLLE